VYKYQNLAGWSLSAVGIGLMSLLKTSSPTSQWIGYQIIEGVGIGILYTATQFPILASLPVSETAHALALFTFIRTFSQVRIIQYQNLFNSSILFPTDMGCSYWLYSPSE
jgi:hypothetical protein